MSSFTDSLPLSSPGVFNPASYLAKFGYAAGKGLGKNEDGMRTHIAVQKKDDAKGIGAHDDYTKSFETLFNQAATSSASIKSGITFFDSDDEEDDKPKKKSAKAEVKVKAEPTAAADDEDDEKARKRRKKEEKKRKKEQKREAEAAASSDDEDDQPKAKKSKHSPSSSPSSSPAASPPAPIQPKTLPSSSIHFIQFSLGSKLLPESHREVDLKGEVIKSKTKAEVEEEEIERSRKEMKYISATKPRPAASSIPKAKENATIKHGAAVKEQNGGHHLYHDRSQGKMKRLEEADRAFLEQMKARQAGATPSPSPSPSSSNSGAFTSPLFAAPSPSPSPAPSTPMDETTEETEEERKARKAAKKAKKEAKKAKREQ